MAWAVRNPSLLRATGRNRAVMQIQTFDLHSGPTLHLSPSPNFLQIRDLSDLHSLFLRFVPGV